MQRLLHLHRRAIDLAREHEWRSRLPPWHAVLIQRSFVSSIWSAPDIRCLAHVLTQLLRLPFGQNQHGCRHLKVNFLVLAVRRKTTFTCNFFFWGFARAWKLTRILHKIPETLDLFVSERLETMHRLKISGQKVCFLLCLLSKVWEIRCFPDRLLFIFVAQVTKSYAKHLCAFFVSKISSLLWNFVSTHVVYESAYIDHRITNLVISIFRPIVFRSDDSMTYAASLTS